MDLALGTVAVVYALATDKLAVAIVTCVRHNRPSLNTIRRRTLAGGAATPIRSMSWT